MMMPDTQQKPVSYLRSILLDGGKPFLYRKGIRALLGTSEPRISKMAFFANIFPIGLIYRRGLLRGRVSITHPLLLGSTANSLAFKIDGVHKLNLQPSIPPAQIQMDAKNTPSTPIGKVYTSTQLESQNLEQVRATVSDQVQQPSQKPEQLGSIPESEAIDIPGVSQQVQDFSAVLFTEPKPTALPPVAEPLKPSSSQPKPDIAAATALNTSGNFAVQKAKIRPANFNLPADLPKEAERLVYKNAPLAASSIAKPENKAIPIPKVDKVLRSEKSLQFDVTTQQAAHRNIERLAQLRGEVRTLTHPSDSGQQAPAETPSRPLSPPAPIQQPAATIKPAISQPKVPYAFWERSYLSHTRIRLLR